MGFGGRLCDVVPEASHRLQLLHNISCGGVQDGFLVYASSTTIIRVVHVVVEPRVSWTYRAALEAIQKGYFTWIYGEHGTVPQFDSAQLGHCIDQATLEQTLMLWKALVKLINDRGEPLPPAKHIIPTLVALWNRVKGGIDVYSRYLKNVKSKHYRLSPTATVWLRMLMTLVYNAHQTFLLLQSHSFLTNRTLCTTYKAYQKHKQNLPSFAAFCREAAVALSQRPKAAQPLSIVDGNTRQTSTFDLNGTFAYKKRVHFETEKEWIDLRLSKTEAHIATRIEGALQRSCILCCRHNHDIENQGHSRLGFKTSFECNVCKVLLCRTKRWDNDQSCFDKFHAQGCVK
ncbi:hypothetical protein DVH05_001017 [Phytophthora capsici]|nr:hypothetical protein DVH05_001017 [Phytophthora capsici]